jgi:hypothetical protein
MNGRFFLGLVLVLTNTIENRVKLLTISYSHSPKTTSSNAAMFHMLVLVVANDGLLDTGNKCAIIVSTSVMPHKCALAVVCSPTTQFNASTLVQAQGMPIAVNDHTMKITEWNYAL